MHVPLRPELSDPQLVLAANAGDREAYQIIISRHQRAVFGYLRARLLDAADAEDLCQEVFLRAYLALKKFSGEISARPWLLGFARNVLREHLRKLSRRQSVMWTELCLQVDASHDLQDGPFEDALELLPDCLAELGPSARLAIELRYSGQLNHARIGQKLHRTADAVKLMLYRSRRALKRCLEMKMSGGSAAGR